MKYEEIRWGMKTIEKQQIPDSNFQKCPLQDEIKKRGLIKKSSRKESKIFEPENIWRSHEESKFDKLELEKLSEEIIRCTYPGIDVLKLSAYSLKD